MVSIQASVSKGWLNRFGGFSFGINYYLDPLFRFKQDKKIEQFLIDKFPEYPLYNMEDNLVQAEYVKDNQILVGGLQPNLIVGSILGSDFTFFDDKDSDINSKPLQNIESINELPDKSALLNSKIVKTFTEQINFLKNEYPQYRIIPPFFWDTSGRATIHGIITTSHKLVGEEIFMQMIMNPDLVHSIHKWITDTYITLINYFAELTELQITSIHIGECSCTMLSPQHFEEFVLPYINVLGEKFDKIRFHSCGKSDSLLNTFSKISSLRSIDVGSGTDIKKIRDIFGNKISISTFPSPDLLTFGSDRDNILLWVDRLLEDNKDGDLRISYHIEPDYIVENCLAINDYLRDKYNITQKRLY